MSEQHSDKVKVVRALIRAQLLLLEEDPQFSDEDSLVISRRLSSLQVVELAAQLESRYQLDFAAHGFNQYDFDSVVQIVDLIEKHRTL